MISFFSEFTDFMLPNEAKSSEWISMVVGSYDKKIDSISFVFCSDDYLLKLNRQFLGHDYLTDILTFPHHESSALPLSADIYISIDRVKENAEDLSIPFQDELDRVIIHGILHLIGFDDHSESDKASMREAENKALLLRK